MCESVCVSESESESESERDRLREMCSHPQVHNT